MEPVKIDWKNIDSVFVKEDLYENINAPKWVDFSAPEESVDDDAWFCRSDCKHPKRVEDFFKLTPPSSSKRPGSGKVSEVLPLGDRNKRESNLKRRGLAQPQSSVSSNIDAKFNEDSENQNPNWPTPPNQQAKSLKAMIKSSAEKNNSIDNDSTNEVQNDKTPKLRSTLSARNLFAGRDILSHITEFCSELKKMAMRAKERENVESSGDLDGRNKEKKLELSKEISEPLVKSNISQEKMRIKKRAENFPKSLDLKNINRKEDENSMHIRTNPPSPQCFSATRGLNKPTPTKGSKSRLMEKENHQEAEKSTNKEELVDKLNNGGSVPILTEKDAKNIDMFWFLKPCTLSS